MKYLKRGLIAGLIAGLFFSVAVFLYVSNTLNNRAPTGRLKSFQELGLVLTDLDGVNIDLNQFNNKTILINFWGTWCGPCLKEMPLLQEAYDNMDDKYVFIMISDESLDKLKAFKEKKGYTFLFARTDTDLKSLIGTFPTTCILDNNKNIIFQKAGAFDGLEVSDMKRLLLENAVHP